MSLLFIILIVGGGIALWSMSNKKHQAQLEQSRRDDAKADAERWTERLGSQVLGISGTDTASTQAMADASERYNAANSALATAQTQREFALARESALEGLHYVNAAREIMGMPAGPELPPLEGQRQAGRVTERRTIEHEGQTITASPTASSATPNYYPGGTVAGRPVPAGWYSTPWWASALSSGMWTMGSVMLFSSLFTGMAGAPSAAAFEQGYEEGLADGAADAGAEDFGGEDFGGAEGMDDGGFFGGDGGDGGGFFDGGFDGFDGFDF